MQAVAVVAVLVSAGLAAARARSDPRWRPAMTAVIPIGLAVFMTAALRLSFPARTAYPLLSMVAAALVWFGVGRVGEPPWRAAGRDACEMGGETACGMARAGTVPVTGPMTTTGPMTPMGPRTITFPMASTRPTARVVARPGPHARGELATFPPLVPRPAQLTARVDGRARWP